MRLAFCRVRSRHHRAQRKPRRRDTSKHGREQRDSESELRVQPLDQSFSPSRGLLQADRERQL